MTPSTEFLLNGEVVDLAGGDPRESLLRWLRRRPLPGTKEGCADGDCGACTVALLEPDGQGGGKYQAVNSCLLPMGVLPGRDVLTVEALAEGEALHPVQQALVDCAGSQCGYCTPGFVMSLFVGAQEGSLGDDAIEGNLCRCTGYRPIRDAAARLAAAPPPADRFSARRARRREALPAAQLGSLYSPVDIEAAIALKTSHPGSAWLAGGTDLGVALSHGRPTASVLIALDRIPALQQLDIGVDAVRIGAGVPLARLEHELAGIFPMLDELWPWFAGRQVRNRATLGGNLGTASPIGDLLPVLLALDAGIHLRGAAGTRTVPVADFFQGYRQTARQEHELVEAVTLPRLPGWHTALFKVAKRQTDDISIVAAAFALQLDSGRRVLAARLAYGGVAAVPLRALDVEAFLAGRVLDAAAVDEAANRLRACFTPLSDHRAGADYRRELCAGLFARFVAERLP